MSTQSPSSSWGWSHWYRRALPAYWLFLFCGMHLPKPRLDLPVPSWDRLAHALVYAILAFLFWRFAETLHRPLSGRFVWMAWVTLALYAVFDEWLQQFVGRSTDPLDWLCDVAGVTVVLVVMEWRRRRSLAATSATAAAR